MEIKEAVEELKLYRKNNSRIASIKSRIADLNQRKYSLSGGDSCVVDGGQLAADDKLLSLLQKIQELTSEMLDEELHGLCVQNDIERKIYKLREPYCSVLRGYFVEAKNMERLAVELNYTFDGIKQIKRRGIKLYAKLPALYSKASYEEEIC